jgi:hypothetical protein
LLVYEWKQYNKQTEKVASYSVEQAKQERAIFVLEGKRMNEYQPTNSNWNDRKERNRAINSVHQHNFGA